MSPPEQGLVDLQCLGQGFSAVAQLAFGLDNSLWWGLSCASRMFNSIPGLDPLRLWCHHSGRDNRNCLQVAKCPQGEQNHPWV